jgi:predicted small integral membrane protein
MKMAHREYRGGVMLRALEVEAEQETGWPRWNIGPYRVTVGDMMYLSFLTGAAFALLLLGILNTPVWKSESAYVGSCWYINKYDLVGMQVPGEVFCATP